jgi:hypothetical protein
VVPGALDDVGGHERRVVEELVAADGRLAGAVAPISHLPSMDSTTRSRSIGLPLRC